METSIRSILKKVTAAGFQYQHKSGIGAVTVTIYGKGSAANAVFSGRPSDVEAGIAEWLASLNADEPKPKAKKSRRAKKSGAKAGEDKKPDAKKEEVSDGEGTEGGETEESVVK